MPFVPYEFTRVGFLQRLNVYIQNENFSSNGSVWPSISYLKTVFAEENMACVDACQSKGLFLIIF